MAIRAAYYLAPSERLTRFDPLFEQEEILVTAFDTAQIPSLTAFLTRDKGIAQQSYIILDLGGAELWSPAHILSAVQQLRRFSPARLIALGEDCPAVTELFGILAEQLSENGLIKESSGCDVEAELRSCLNDAPRFANRLELMNAMLVQQAERVVRPLHIPAGLTITVAVAGTMPRCGTTTQTFALYHALRKLGWRAAIWDRFDRLLPLLTQYEEYEALGEYAVRIRSVELVTQQTSDYNAYIMDCGILREETLPLFAGAEVSVLVGGTKPWEIPALADAHALLRRSPARHLVTLAGCSTPEVLEELGQYLDGTLTAAPYEPDLWTLTDERSYRDVLLPHLKDVCGASAGSEEEQWEE